VKWHALYKEKRSKNRRGVHRKCGGKELSGTVNQQFHKMQSYGSWDGMAKGP